MAIGLKKVRIITVFVSSPGDVQEERNALERVVESINRSDGERSDVRLEIKDWKSMTPQMGPKPQAVIDSKLGMYEIYIGIMYKRFGTKTGRFDSGTEKEFNDAYKRWQVCGLPWIMFYFNTHPFFPSTEQELDQLQKVMKFRKKLEKQGLFKLFGETNSAQNFYELVSEHLRNVLHEVIALDNSSERTPSRDASNANDHSIPEAYRQWVLDEYGDMQLLGLKVKHAQALKLSSVYIPLVTRLSAAEFSARPRRTVKQEMTGRKVVLLDLLERGSVYISGAPGSGKSTFSRWLAWLTCNGTMPTERPQDYVVYTEHFPDLLRTKLPLLVRLRELWRHFPKGAGRRELSRRSLEESLEIWFKDAPHPGLRWGTFQERLENGTALLILDGIDEVPIAATDDGKPYFPRAMIISAITASVQYWASKGNIAVTTSRPYGVQDEERRRFNMIYAPISEMDNMQQDTLIHHWFRVLEADEDRAEAMAEEMASDIRGRGEVEALTSNPMLLTAMCVVYHEGRRLPQDIYDLYSRIVDNVLHNRYPGATAFMDQVRTKLSVIAFGMHTGEGLDEYRKTPFAVTTDKEIDTMLSLYRANSAGVEAGQASIEEIREDLLSNSGLLLPRDNRGAEFSHSTFQDFLAARRLLDVEDNPDRLYVFFVSKSDAPEWRNTLSLAYASLLSNYSSPERSINLLGRLIEFTSFDRGIHLGLKVLASQCFRILMGKKYGMKTLHADRLREICLEAIEHECSETQIQERSIFGLALGLLGDSRIPEDPRDSANYVLIPAGEYTKRSGTEGALIRVSGTWFASKYPVTNAQYKQFVDAKGYLNIRNWSENGWRWLQHTGFREPAFWGSIKWNGPNQPVVGVSFWEAEAFCNWVDARLPTSEEWEIATGGPKRANYPWGDGAWDGICNSQEAGLSCTSSVGIFPLSRSNFFDLEDMAGNIAHWTTTNAYTPKGQELEFVVKGGGYNEPINSCDVDSHSEVEARDRRSDIGFRPFRGICQISPAEPE